MKKQWGKPIVTVLKRNANGASLWAMCKHGDVMGPGFMPTWPDNCSSYTDASATVWANFCVAQVPS